MKDIRKPLQDLEQIARVTSMPKSRYLLAEAKRFMEAVMDQQGHFTKYSMNITYGKDGELDCLRLDLYFMAD